MLLGTIYVDIRDTEWAVALAYGRTHYPKLRGPEPVYEVRYAFQPGNGSQVTHLDTRDEELRAITAEPFTSIDAFVLWTLKEERSRISGPVR